MTCRGSIIFSVYLNAEPWIGLWSVILIDAFPGHSHLHLYTPVHVSSVSFQAAF